MSFYVFLKVFADLCLYFGCIGALPALFPHSFFFLWPAIICAACAGISAFLSDQGRNRGRFLFLVLTVTCFLFGKGLMEWMILFPPIAYTLVMIFRDEWGLEYFHFRETFRRALIVLGIALLVVHFGGIIETGGHKGTVLNSNALLQNALIYALCGILLQRQLRLGTGNVRDKDLNNLQLALVTICAALLLGSIIAAEWILSSQGISLRNVLGQALRTIFGIPLYLISYLLTLIMGLNGQVLQQIQDTQAVETEPSPTALLPPMGEAVLEQQPVETAFPWWLAILILAALTTFLILLTQVLRNRITEANRGEIIEKFLPKAAEKQPSRRSNRSKLRKIYREFLRAEKRKGHMILPCHTSADILHDLKPEGDPEAAARLRRLYLPARYDLDSPVTAQQVQEAKNALRQYKND